VDVAPTLAALFDLDGGGFDGIVLADALASPAEAQRVAQGLLAGDLSRRRSALQTADE